MLKGPLTLSKAQSEAHVIRPRGRNQAKRWALCYDPPVSEAPAPKAMKQAGPLDLAIDWSDGHASVFPVRLLRLSCPCAQCVDEMSGQKLLNDASVPADVKPVVINPVGRYAVHIDWSDGHRTGIYTYVHLRAICPCAECAKRNA